MKNKILVFLMGLIFSSFNCFAATNTSVFIENAQTSAISTADYLAENIVYDSVTAKYWWIFTDHSGANDTIRIASSTLITGPWTAQGGTVIAVASTDVYSPFLVKYGSTWYIYFSYDGSGGDIYVYTSSSVNTGYTDPGGVNPILSNGAGGAWDERRVGEPVVYYDGTTYHMLFMGETVGTLLEKCGYASATSPTGPFTKYGSNPVLGGETTYWSAGQDTAADPTIYPYNGSYLVGITETYSAKNFWGVSFYITTDFINYTRTNYAPSLRRTAFTHKTDTQSAHRGDIFVDTDGNKYFPYTGKHEGGQYRMFLGRVWLYGQ